MDVFQEFCGSALWNSTLTWHSQQPDLTTCFEKTVLAWTPCAFLLIFTPLEIHYIRRSTNGYVPWNWMNVAKLVLSLICVLPIVCDLSTTIGAPTAAYTVDYVTPVVRMVSHIWAAVLLVWNRQKGLRTSGSLTLFWLLSIIVSALGLWTQIHERAEGGPFPLNVVAFLVMALLLFILNCFVDVEPTRHPFAEKEERCPEFDSSFVSKLLFTWYDKMAWRGYRGTLDQGALWQLNPEDKSSGVVPLFQRHWDKQKALAEAASKTGAPRRTVSVVPALLKSFGATFLFGAIMELAGTLLSLASPQILK